MNETEPKQTYEDFILTLPYGKIKSEFDVLPDDIINKCIRPYLSHPLSIKFKHKLLQHKHQKDLHPELLKEPKWTSLNHYDGSYHVVPSITKYADFDRLTHPRQKKTFKHTINNVRHTLLLTHRAEKNTLKLYCPRSQCKKDNKTDFICLITQKKNLLLQSYTFSSATKLHVASCDKNWIVCSMPASRDNLIFINTKTFKPEVYYSFNGNINTIRAAHNSPLFAICCDNGIIALTTPTQNNILKISLTSLELLSVEFSPHDKQLLVYNKNEYFLINLDNSYSYAKAISNNLFTKVIFSPDGENILKIFQDGTLQITPSSSCILSRKKPSKNAKWRHKNQEIVNDKPLTLWSNKHHLLFLLNSTDTINQNFYSFIIYSSITNSILGTYKFVPCNPIAMGLNIDENSVIFIYNSKEINQLNIYDKNELNDIDFIENTATLYQLNTMWHIYKNNKILSKQSDIRHETLFINNISAYINQQKNNFHAL